MFSSRPVSGVGRVEARGQAAPDRGESSETEEGGDGADTADEAGAKHSRVGADQDGDRGPPAHQLPGLQLETEAQVPGELLVWSRQSRRQSAIFTSYWPVTLFFKRPSILNHI